MQAAFPERTNLPVSVLNVQTEGYAFRKELKINVDAAYIKHLCNLEEITT